MVSNTREVSNTRKPLFKMIYSNNSYRYPFLLFLLFAATIAPLQAQTSLIYVNQNANGANDGSSWLDAYTHLSDALTNPTAETWVAAGTYYPDSDSSNVSFDVHGTQQLYGGFAGNETMRSQRDRNQNQTILSGDIGQDDMMSPAMSDSQLVGSNSMHVISYQATSNSDVIIDGFVITAGQTTTEEGAAISVLLANSNQNQINLSIRNCRFSGNLAFKGGAIAVNCATCVQNVIIEDCEFVGNASKGDITGSRGGAILFFGESGTILNNQIRRSEFESNESSLLGGAVYVRSVQATNQIIIDSCLFQNNRASSTLGGYGGAIAETSLGGIIEGKISNSTFIGNEVESVFPGSATYEAGGAIVLYGVSLIDKSSFDFETCQFDSNQVKKNGTGDCIHIVTTQQTAGSFPLTDFGLSFKSCNFNNNGSDNGKPNYGGAISLETRFVDINLEIDSSSFYDNQAQKGGAIYLNTSRQANISLDLRQSVFVNNVARIQGGGIYIKDNNFDGYSSITSLQMEHCRFIGNTGKLGGAFCSFSTADPIGSLDYNFKQNYFENNSSTDNGGALLLEIQGVNQNISFEQDTFLNNQATNSGGAISFLPGYYSSPTLYADRVYFTGNTAEYGGAISLIGDNSVLDIFFKNAQFHNNSAIDGGAIFAEELRGNARLENILMTQNQASNHAAAGHFSNQSSFNLDILGSTFSQNTSQAGVDLFYFSNTPVFQPFPINISNSIMWENGSSADIVTQGNAVPTISYSLLDFPTPGTGNISADPEFMDPINDDFQLKWNSPAIDTGDNVGVSDSLDLNGHPRIQGSAVDLGAYESPFTTPIETHRDSKLTVFPNPSQGQVLLSLPHVSTHVDEVTVTLYDPLGKLVFQDRFAERSASTLALDFGSLSPGLFLLTVQMGEQTYSESLIIH